MKPKFKVGTLVKVEKDRGSEIQSYYGEITAILTGKDGFSYHINNDNFIDEADILQAYAPIAKPRTRKPRAKKQAKIDTWMKETYPTEEEEKAKGQVQ